MSNPLHQISAQINYYVQVLNDYAKNNGGQCQEVPNMRDMWMQASQSSQIPMIYITWTGDKPYSSSKVLEGLTHRVQRHWTVGIKRGRGFTAVRGATLSTTTSTIPFFDVVEDVRDIIRSQLGLSEDLGTDNVESKEWQLGNLVMDGKLISFTTQNDIPVIQNTIDEPVTQLI